MEITEKHCCLNGYIAIKSIKIHDIVTLNHCISCIKSLAVQD